MNQSFKKGLLWGAGSLVSFFFLACALGNVIWAFDGEEAWERDWQLTDQKNLEVKSYATRIIDHPSSQSELLISGELEGDLNPPVTDAENELAMAAIARDRNSVVLSDCQDYFSYSKYELSETKSFVLSCPPPEKVEDIGGVEFVIKHAWR
ncbi:hypothetical protein [Marinobacter sp. JSM 1782161]|uniref:hypothetical protein n=1 Tax=Marinobacter sp. JSM 1782161 TaxID=2685906 RepID=UPI0014027002|nr:hypothetical protein [Marinobacter sp. JSM 1782161]